MCGFRSHSSAAKHAASATSDALLVLHVPVLRTLNSMVFIALRVVMIVLLLGFTVFCMLLFGTVRRIAGLAIPVVILTALLQAVARLGIQ